jgi:hypothetical protein
VTAILAQKPLKIGLLVLIDQDWGPDGHSPRHPRRHVHEDYSRPQQLLQHHGEVPLERLNHLVSRVTTVEQNRRVARAPRVPLVAIPPLDSGEATVQVVQKKLPLRVLFGLQLNAVAIFEALPLPSPTQHTRCLVASRSKRRVDVYVIGTVFKNPRMRDPFPPRGMQVVPRPSI